MEARNSGKMHEEFEQNSGKIRAKIGGKNKETTAENSGKFTGREWKIKCIFKSIKLLENNSQELAQFYV